MPIKLVMPPAPVIAAFAGGLPRFLSATTARNGRSDESHKFAGADPDIPRPSDLGLTDQGVNVNRIDKYHPYPVFTLSLQAAATNGPTPSAEPDAWGFFVGDPKGAMVRAKVNRATPSGTWKLAAVYYGDHVARMRKAAEELESLAETKKNRYELRLLRVPAVNSAVFWLAAQDSRENDLAVPILSLKRQQTKPSSLHEFQQSIVSSARDRLVHPATHGW